MKKSLATQAKTGLMAVLRSAETLTVASLSLVTSGFVNYFVPEGYGGVFTCERGGPCGVARRPQPEFLSGEVLITTNSQTDGKTAPEGGSGIEAFYNHSQPKDLQSHFEQSGTSGLHLLSIEFRGREDIGLWVLGRGREDRLELEWRDLFEQPRPDGSSGENGCGCGAVRFGDASALWWCMLLFVVRRWPR